jgi:hypothetical protein
MVWIILAAGLGTANYIAYALLFRRARQLARQLSDMRAERNSEWILHALQDVPEERERAAIAANGYTLAATHQQPVRRKRHLGLYLGGGGLAGILAAYGRRAPQVWAAHRMQAIGAAVGVAVVSTTAAMVLTSLPNASSSGPPSAAPRRTSTVIHVPGHAQQAPSVHAWTWATLPMTEGTPTPALNTPIGQTPTGAPDPGQTGTASAPPAGGDSPIPVPVSPAPPASSTGKTLSAVFLQCFALVVDPVLRAKLCQEGG